MAMATERMRRCKSLVRHLAAEFEAAAEALAGLESPSAEIVGRAVAAGRGGCFELAQLLDGEPIVREWMPEPPVLEHGRAIAALEPMTAADVRQAASLERYQRCGAVSGDIRRQKVLALLAGLRPDAPDYQAVPGKGTFAMRWVTTDPGGQIIATMTLDNFVYRKRGFAAPLDAQRDVVRAARKHFGLDA